jgi:hypothetical protein
MQVVDGKFTDHRWKNGAWDLESDAFKKDGKTNWDLVGCSANCLCKENLQRVQMPLIHAVLHQSTVALQRMMHVRSRCFKLPAFSISVYEAMTSF